MNSWVWIWFSALTPSLCSAFYVSEQVKNQQSSQRRGPGQGHKSRKSQFVMSRQRAGGRWTFKQPVCVSQCGLLVYALWLEAWKSSSEDKNPTWCPPAASAVKQTPGQFSSSWLRVNKADSVRAGRHEEDSVLSWKLTKGPPRCLDAGAGNAAQCLESPRVRLVLVLAAVPGGRRGGDASRAAAPSLSNSTF